MTSHSGFGMSRKAFLDCQPVPAAAPEQTRTHIPLLYFVPEWKPLWRVKVSGETKMQETPQGEWLTAEGAGQVLGPLVKAVSPQNSRPSVTPRGAAQ
ncbi:hypothetical protein [Gluconobacter cerinus]|uniref:hypothetical protein n=1 Tax=Gluconobacter cerinus TaxID=38307 RepID=UPI001B8D9243|nr:hypothetical protein [Gluconobacter cerinus]MBS0995424.1 hypothetical protein [Gluconobacter cerinus]